MPGPVPLSQNDFGVLSKILDPESDPFTKNAPIDPSLPPDPHVTDKAVYAEATREEWTVIQKLRSLDEELAATTMRRSSRSSSRKSPSSENPASSREAAAEEDGSPDDPVGELLRKYRACVGLLDDLVAKAPNYASAHNNRAQLLRRIYGDGLLVSRAVVDAAEAEAAAAAPAAVEGEGDKDLNEGSLWGDNTNAMEKLLSPSEISDEERARVASTILTDLTTAIELLMPATYRTPVSPQAARTLANAYTQRGAVYLATARLMRRYSSRLQEPQRHIFEDMAIMDRRIYGGRGPVDFEEAAAADFAAAARFGGELARRLAVPANPTAKLCGEMVRAAMREEYGDVFAGGAKEDGQ